MKTWKNQKLDYIESFYGNAYRLFKEQDPHDDRRLYMNVYKMIIKALQSLPDEPDLYVRVALNKQIDDDLALLTRIGKRFGVDDFIFNKEEPE